MYRIEEAYPSVDEYRRLRASVGWRSPSPADCQVALEATGFSVVARHRGEAVGMARIVGDKVLYLLIVDVAVHPDHQGRGLGRRMIDELTRWTSANGTRSTMLVAGPDVVPFYEALGFRPDPGRLMKRP